MDLRDYPRPKDDTGIGVHWNAGFAAAIGLGQIEQYLAAPPAGHGRQVGQDLPSTTARWTLRACCSRTTSCRSCASIGRSPTPAPWHEKLQAVNDYVSAGVRYFEFNNEPDLGVEWQGG